MIKDVTSFVYEIAREEKNGDRRKKLLNLILDDTKWERLKKCLDLLAVSNIPSLLCLLAHTMFSKACGEGSTGILL